MDENYLYCEYEKTSQRNLAYIEKLKESEFDFLYA